VVLTLLGGLLTYMYWPAGPVEIIISRETTYILSPLNPDGTPNYVKYLDDKYAEGVTADNNAAPLLLRALGPDVLPAEIRVESLRRLNLPADMFDHDKHFIEWDDHVSSREADADDAASSESDKRGGYYYGPSLYGPSERLLDAHVHPDRASWLASNAGPLDLLRQATARDRLYLPVISTSTPPNMLYVVWPDYEVLAEAAWALAVRAVLKSSCNDIQGAWEDVLTAHRLARLLDRSPFLAGRTIGSIADDRAAQAGIAMATRHSLLPGKARALLSKLLAAKPTGDIVEVIDEGERFWGLDLIMMAIRDVRTGGASLSPFGDRCPDWNRMLRDVTATQDKMAKPFHLPRLHGREEARQALTKMWEEFAAQPRRDGAIREFLLQYGGRLTRGARTDIITNWVLCEIGMRSYEGHFPALEECSVLADRAKMTCEIEMLAVALACYHAEHGRWPGELKELCPSLLKAIPADRFSVKPLIYKPGEKGYLLYSVGMNLIDDGGIHDGRRKDDIVAEVKPVDKNSK